MIKTNFRPSLLQQSIRALFHMCQFALAYLIMLLAMYYNGFIILSIFIGSYIGAFVFSWETISVFRPADTADTADTKIEEATYCCG
jgi:copper transporter 1